MTQPQYRKPLVVNYQGKPATVFAFSLEEAEALVAEREQAEAENIVILADSNMLKI